MLLIYDDEAQRATTEQDMAGVMQEYFAYTDSLTQRGAMKEGAALDPISTARTVRVRDGQALVVDGPFAETKELVAGFWIWQVKSIEEAVEWVRRCPDPMPGEESELEIRPLFEMEDFAPAAG
jgi:hypothetical protein